MNPSKETKEELAALARLTGKPQLLRSSVPTVTPPPPDPFMFHKEFARRITEMDMSAEGLASVLIANFGPTRKQTLDLANSMLRAFAETMAVLRKQQQERHLHAAYSIEHVRNLFIRVFGKPMPDNL